MRVCIFSVGMNVAISSGNVDCRSCNQLRAWMPKRKKVIFVTFNHEQRARLEKLWFYYGNYGPQTTPGSHSFIQRLLEGGYDERPLYNTRTPKSERPTPECEMAVDGILGKLREADKGSEH